MQNSTANLVTEIATLPSDEAASYFAQRLRLETDCWDVHSTQGMKDRGFVLLDVRAEDFYDREHLPGAVSLPFGDINDARLASYEQDMLFVVYCSGPHCNGSQRAALRLAKLGRRVKEMIGGVEGWKDMGYKLSTTASKNQIGAV